MGSLYEIQIRIQNNNKALWMHYGDTHFPKFFIEIQTICILVVYIINRFTSMIENTSSHNLHSSLVLNESIWWCRVMIFLCSLYWRKMRQKVKSSSEHRFTLMVQRKTTKFEKENFELSVFLYANSHPKANILLPCNALQYYYSL